MQQDATTIIERRRSQKYSTASKNLQNKPYQPHYTSQPILERRDLVKLDCLHQDPGMKLVR